MPKYWENQPNKILATCKKIVDLFCIIFKLELEHDILKVHAKFQGFFVHGFKNLVVVVLQTCMA